MRTLSIAAFLVAVAAPALADVDDAHVIANDRVGPFTLGMAEKDALDALVKTWQKSDIKLGDADVEVPHLKLHFSGARGKRTLSWIEVKTPTFGASPYKTKEGVGPGSSEKDVRLAYRNEVKRRKVGSDDGLTPDALPAVHFVCSKGGVFTSDSCPTVTVRHGSK
jgi:hypothetical protein